MAANDFTDINHFELQRQACLDWQKDGCPPGCETNYLLLRAKGLPNRSKYLPAIRIQPQPSSEGKIQEIKIKFIGTRKTAARLELE